MMIVVSRNMFEDQDTCNSSLIYAKNSLLEPQSDLTVKPFILCFRQSEFHTDYILMLYSHAIRCSHEESKVYLFE